MLTRSIGARRSSFLQNVSSTVLQVQPHDVAAQSSVLFRRSLKQKKNTSYKQGAVSEDLSQPIACLVEKTAGFGLFACCIVRILLISLSLLLRKPEEN